MPMPQTQASLIDRLGTVQQSLADLRSIEKRLIGEIGRLGVGYYEGKFYTACVALIVDARGGVDVTVKRKEGIKR